jgi:DNA-binding transcriptional regulator YdaS (Cro superfamily)
MNTNNHALQTLLFAIGRFDSQAEFARQVKRRPQEVWNWINRDKKAPVEACPFIEAACNHPRVTCEKLRPDYEGWKLMRK